MDNDFSLEKEITIDPNALDVEWLGQAERFFRVSRLAAKARADVDRAKLDMDVTEAELDSAIRERPEEFGLAKVSEAAIAKSIALQENMIEARRVFLEAKETLSLLDSAVTAFEHRKKALENLVFLHGQSYFAGPKVPRDLDVVLQGGRFKKSGSKLNEHLSKAKKKTKKTQ